MAKILYTAMIGGLSASIAGTTFSRNRYGSYMRNKTSPVQPHSVDQLSQRANFASVSSLWRSLDAATQLAWKTFAAAYPFTDVFGSTMYLTPNALFIKLNLNLLSIGEPVITVPVLPLTPTVFTIDDITATSGTNVLDVTISLATAPSGFKFQVFCTPNLSPGKNFVKNLYRSFGRITDTAGVMACGGAYVTKFGDLVASQQVNVKVRMIDIASGFAGGPVISAQLVS